MSPSARSAIMSEAPGCPKTDNLFLHSATSCTSDPPTKLHSGSKILLSPHCIYADAVIFSFPILPSPLQSVLLLMPDLKGPSNASILSASVQHGKFRPKVFPACLDPPFFSLQEFPPTARHLQRRIRFTFCVWMAVCELLLQTPAAKP